MNIKDIRRANMRALATSVGGITPIAERLGKSQSQISHLIGVTPIKNIGDKIAAQVEVIFKKPHGWMDREHGIIDEETATYMVGHDVPGCNHYIVPLITWKEARHLHKPVSAYRNVDSQALVTSAVPVSKHAFALRVRGDSMQTYPGISFPEDSIIILDPDYVASSQSFVVASLDEGDDAVFKQLIVDGNKRFLKPLNPRYPIIEIERQVIICGVVRQMLMIFQNTGSLWD